MVAPPGVDDQRGAGAGSNRLARLIVVLVVLSLIVAVVVVVRQLTHVEETSQPVPSAPATSAPPRPPVRTAPKPTGRLVRRLEALDLTCVGLQVSPSISGCYSGLQEHPGSELDWVIGREQRVDAFRWSVDLTGSNAAATMPVVDALGGDDLLGGADLALIRSAIEDAVRTGEADGYRADWGWITVDYVDSIELLSIAGTRYADGDPMAGQVDVPLLDERPFASSYEVIRSYVIELGYACELDPANATPSRSMRCSKPSVDLTFYFTTDDPRPHSLMIYNSEQRGDGTDKIAAARTVLRVLVAEDVAELGPMITEQRRATAFTGAARGYLLRISRDELTLDGVGWY
ncbi:hypothetical protein [Microlunatus soli]|uniref:Uncharacterized protein n=1 Tax=Microlunatus soli TaxID=630515 RepID=A0A1H1NL93_9ACTN|nr:hypothetical protein [Microlunatus soli]SDR99738.1 hypothetical protein SAMN04489812_0557 [Microlunatus soli]